MHSLDIGFVTALVVLDVISFSRRNGFLNHLGAALLVGAITSIAGWDLDGIRTHSLSDPEGFIFFGIFTYAVGVVGFVLMMFGNELQIEFSRRLGRRTGG